MYILIRYTGCEVDSYPEPLVVSQDKAKLKELAKEYATNDKLAVILKQDIDEEHSRLEVEFPFIGKPPKPIKQIGKVEHKKAKQKYQDNIIKWCQETYNTAKQNVLNKHNLPTNFMDTVCLGWAEYKVKEIEEV